MNKLAIIVKSGGCETGECGLNLLMHCRHSFTAFSEFALPVQLPSPASSHSNCSF